MTPSSSIRTVQILLTVTAFEFFGPAVRDSGVSHLLNVDWVGHARLHLAWLLGFMVTSGIVNLYYIWRARPSKAADLWISFLWQGCNLVGFWIATVFVDGYGGAIIDPKHHHLIFGVDENVLAFTGLTTIFLIALVIFRTRVLPSERVSGHVHAA
ncbi:MAG: hypothetical protein AAGF92_15080 [Myxococcota bacterium]